MPFIYMLWQYVCKAWLIIPGQAEKFILKRFSMGGKCLRVVFIGLTLFISLLGVACSDSSGSGKTSAGLLLDGEQVTLSRLHWCDKPSMIFRDQASPSASHDVGQSSLGPANGTPTTIAEWQIVKEHLGFSVFLPKTLPAGSCLLSVSSSLRDPIFGSNFTITYVLPNREAISFSQAPIRTQPQAFQCSVARDIQKIIGSTGKQQKPDANERDPVQLCNGTREQTSIVFSARGSTGQLQRIFQQLQPDIDWRPL